MGLHFGHHLGLSDALRGLPAAPLVARYGELVSLQQAVGYRHVGEVFLQEGRTFRVLDGLFIPGQGRAWRRVDTAVLRRLEHVGQATALAGRLAEINGGDPTALRRILLYQLLGLLREGEARAGDAVALGVDAAEAAALAHAAQRQPAATVQQRAAADGLEDAWLEKRLCLAGRLAGELPPGARQDPGLARRLKEIAAASRTADRETAAAGVHEERGDLTAAAAHYLRALRLVRDQARALHGLVRTHTSADGSVRAEPTPDAVELSWDDDSGATAWRVHRLTGAAETSGAVAEVAGSVAAPRAEDRRAPLGSEVRYAVVPLRDGVPDGPVRVSPALLVAPEVTGLRLSDGRERVAGSWQRPDGAAYVSVRHTGPDGRCVSLPPQEDGFALRGLGPGEHRFRISCHYRAGDRDIASPGIEAARTVHRWPGAVGTFTAAPGAAEGSVRFAWSGAEDAEVRLVAFPGQAPPSGTEMFLPAAPLPPELPWAPAATAPQSPVRTRELLPSHGTVADVTAVAVRGDRALTGPSVRITVPHPVTALRAERTADGHTRVTFDWPADASGVTVVRTQDGQRHEQHVVRSRFLREGLYLPVASSAARLEAGPALPTTTGVVIPPPVASYALPPDIAIAYRVVPGQRRPLRRKPATVEVTLSLPTEEEGLDLPEFVLVARPAPAGAGHRPRDPADGTTVLRLSGTQLRRSGRVLCHIAPDACRPPYTLRGFLLGGRAAAVRLQELSPTTLVMR